MKRLIALALCLGSSLMAKEEIPLELLFGSADKADPAISPDGQYLGFVAQREGVSNLWVRDLANKKDFPVTNDRHRGIQDYWWGYDNRSLLFVQDQNGDENWNVYSVDILTQEIKQLTPFDKVQVKVAAYSWKHPDEMIVQMNRENPELFDLYRIHLKTGKTEQIYKNPGNIGKYLIDTDLQLVGYQTYNDDGSSDIWVKSAKRQIDKHLLHWEISEEMIGESLNIADGYLYALDARKRDTASLVKIDLITGSSEEIYANDQYDVGQAFFHPTTQKVIAVGVEGKRCTIHPVDSHFQSDFAFLQIHLAEKRIWIANTSLDHQKWVILAGTDTQPFHCYLYDRSTQTLEQLFACRPEVSRYDLVKMEPIAFQARDGLQIEGYLTRPNPNGKNLPLVLVVHGGPQSRDTWGYNTVVQWLANRGYAALQINYRGSSGYGKSFLDAGIREWGRNMQNDLTDGVQWAITQGIADPERIAIFGGSYGGYAALAGATFTPTLYKAAIDYVGPSNLITFLQSIPPYWKMYKAQFTVRVGDPQVDEALLRERSPLFFADKIGIPVLIGHGANDPRVKQAEADQIVAALKANQIPYEYVIYPDEGHGFAKPENRIDFYRRVEKFLKEHVEVSQP